MSLRLRLLLALIALVAAGMVATDTVTYVALQSSLWNRLQQGLLQSVDSARTCVVSQLTHNDCPTSTALPEGSYAAFIGPGGSQEGVVWGSAQTTPRPVLPASVTGGNVPAAPYFFTAPGNRGGVTFRGLLIGVQVAGGLEEPFVVAMPLSSVETTLSQLETLEILVGAVVLVALGVAAWWLVDLGLRPLRRIRDTARKIAGGDLSQRVQGVDEGTEIGQLAISLNEMLAQIERAFAERQESEARLRRFAADASHELRTPLSSIRGYAELFRRGARSNPEDLDKAMSRIESEATRMGLLVDDLLLLARLDRGRPLDRKPVDLAELAVDSAADQSAADRRHRIRVHADSPVLVQGDEARLRQVVTNLVRNAVVHTPEGTAVEIAARIEGDQGLVQVIDHGPGIPDEVAARIFERFYRADRSRGRETGGTGLGLSIVSAIVAAHQGTVEYRPTEGGGATFEVRIPVDRPPAPEPEAEDPQPAIGSGVSSAG
ncbi:MAG: sensor histidine kinase [Candidatus Dormibacteria bacterium]